MANLKIEYTDIKDIKHKVEHLIVSDKEGSNRDRIVEELYHVLARRNKRVPA